MQTLLLRVAGWTRAKSCNKIVHGSPLWMPKPRLFLVPVLGLAAVTGSVGAVGMAGLTLGGG